jgi:hypothetical protein
LPIRLHEVGPRPRTELYEPTPEGLAHVAEALAIDPEKPIDTTTSPYDLLKMQVKLREEDETRWGETAFRTVVDPRTEFAFPRITRLVHPVGDDHPANRYLQTAHWRLNLNALSCKAKQYLQLGWSEVFPGTTENPLGGFEDMAVTVEYLSPTVMGWRESGSIFCGGAHPSNFSNTRAIDVTRGITLDMGRIFRGWRNVSGWPTRTLDAEIIAYVRENRDKSDPERDRECGTDDLIAEHLTISFKQGDRAVFGLEGLPHVIAACEDSLVDVPLADVRHLLTPAAEEYFPSLRTPR